MSAALANLSKIADSPQWRHLFRLLNQDDVSEIHIDDKDKVFAKVKGYVRHVGSIEGYSVTWEGVHDFARTAIDLENNMLHYGTPIKESAFLYEGGLRIKRIDGTELRARVHIVMPPVCDFPIVTIAKEAPLKTMDDLQQTGLMSSNMSDFIRMLVKKRRTIVVTGGTGAGKTTLLTALTSFFDPDEHIAVCEDSPELKLNEKLDTLYMRSSPQIPGSENGRADLAWVVAQVNRQRVNRIIIGETRGAEFADFLTAANSGCSGSLTTLHADSPNRALEKMATFVKRAPGNASTPMTVINSDIAYSIDYVIQIGLYGKHKNHHRISEISEVSNTIHDDASASIATNPIFKYEPDDDDFKQSSWPEDEEIRLGLKAIMGA